MGDGQAWIVEHHVSCVEDIQVDRPGCVAIRHAHTAQFRLDIVQYGRKGVRGERALHHERRVQERVPRVGVGNVDRFSLVQGRLRDDADPGMLFQQGTRRPQVGQAVTEIGAKTEAVFD